MNPANPNKYLRDLLGLQHQLEGVAEISVSKEGRQHTFINEPQAMDWAQLDRQLKDGWMLDRETLDQMPKYAPLRKRHEALEVRRLARAEVEAKRQAERSAREQEYIDEQTEAAKGRPPVWYAIPSIDIAKVRNCLPQWKAAGYRTAVLLHDMEPPTDRLDIDLVLWEDDYRGYAISTNRLCRTLVADGAEVVIAGGDDMFPDPAAKPGDILEEFKAHFGGLFGVMQPTGDDMDGTDRICGSPWLGAEFIRRANGGKGPYWPEYFHYFCDQELFEVAKGLGILWQRPDLTQYHDHHSRTGVQPIHWAETQQNWDPAKKLFDERKAAGFPSSKPL